MKCLSGLEKFFYSRSKLGLHSCFLVAVQLNQSPSRSEICGAIKATVEECPHLYSDVVTKGELPSLEPINEQILLEQVLEYTDYGLLDEDICNKIFREVEFTYGSGKPLWKVLVLNDRRTLVLCTDHVILDGLSTVAFWKKFLGSLNATASTSLVSEVVFEPSVHNSVVPQHPYDRIPVTFFETMARALVQVLVFLAFLKIDLITTLFVPPLQKQYLKFKNYQFTRDYLAADGSVRNDNRLLKIVIPPQKLQNLLALCKGHNVSLSSLILAIMANSLKHVDSSQFDGTRAKISIPMNTRPFIEKTLLAEPKSIEFGNFIVGGELEYDLSDAGDLWQTAAHFRHDLAVQRNVRGSIMSTRLLDLVEVDHLMSVKASERYPSSTFELTNLGLQSFGCSENDKYFVVDSSFHNPQGLSEVFSCAAVATPVGGLNCSISYPKSLSSDLDPSMKFVKESLINLSSS